MNEELLARQLANEAVMEAVLLMLMRERPGFLDRLRSRLDDYRPNARRILSEKGSEAFEKRIDGLLLDLEKLA